MSVAPGTVPRDEMVVHDVLFAESDDELVSVAGHRLATALAGGALSIAIATPDHMRAFAERIRVTGLEPEASVTDGSLVMMDAAETLDRLTPGGSFDPEMFAEVVGSVVRAAAVERPVEAFGEMVGLLWNDGRCDDAIELEAAWDQLVQETSASLLCAYSSSLLDDPRRSDGLATVCGMHSGIVAETSFERSWRLPDDRTAAAEARRIAANALRSRGVAEATFYDAQSVVTELAANAAIHANAPYSIDVRIDDGRVLLGVRDQSPEPPVLGGGGRRRLLSGLRGLPLVDILTARWGVDRLDGGKIVWAELAR